VPDDHANSQENPDVQADLGRDALAGPVLPEAGQREDAADREDRDGAKEQSELAACRDVTHGRA
jgi:hypothetical protein